MTKERIGVDDAILKKAIIPEYGNGSILGNKLTVEMTAIIVITSHVYESVERLVFE